MVGQTGSTERKDAGGVDAEGRSKTTLRIRQSVHKRLKYAALISGKDAQDLADEALDKFLPALPAEAA